MRPPGRKERKQQKRKHWSRKRRWLHRLIILVVVLLVAGVAAGGTAAWFAYRYYQHNAACDPRTQVQVRLGQTSFVYYVDGSLLGAVPAERHRQPVPIGQISPWLPRAIVAVEDRRFFEHAGVDWRGILRAAWADLRAGRAIEGGSTISQQLARNLYGAGSRRSFARKVREACLALKLERRLPKQAILGAYLNQVYFGAGAYGAEAAARTYFDKPAKALTLPEAALIAGLPQSPSRFDPLNSPERARLRRAEVLDAMLRARVIEPAAWAWAKRSPLGLRPGDLYTALADKHLFAAVFAELRKLVSAKAAAYGGLRLTTTVERGLQSQARRAVRTHLHAGDPSAAVVAIRPATGAIRALASVSNAGPLEFDLAWQGRRQPGSAFKAFTLAEALRRGIDPASTYYLSAPFTYVTATGDRWKVRNSEEAYRGGLSLLRATAHSDNTVFTRLTLDLGPSAVAAEAHRLGITSLLAAVPSISLGVNPVSPLEMASAYATIAAGGVYRRPSLLAEVRFPGGKVLRPLARNGVRVLDAQIAAQLTQALAGVIDAGTGTAARLADRPAAGKTGTTSNFTDAWFVGFTPQLSTAVWVGYPRRTYSMTNVNGITVYGGTYPAQIWQAFMTSALAHTVVVPFAEPLPPPRWPYAPLRWRGFYQWRLFGDSKEDAEVYVAWQQKRSEDEQQLADDQAARREHDLVSSKPTDS